MPVTYQQARHFCDVGYLKILDAIEPSLIAQLEEYIEEQHRCLESRSETSAQLKVYHLYKKNEELMTQLIAHKRFVDNLVGLLGPNIVFVTNRHNQSAINAPGRADTRLHRDVLQWSSNVVTVVVYLEDSTESNGCTRIVPGSHYLPFVGVPQPNGGGTWMNEHVEFSDMVDQSVPVPMTKGSLLVFDGLLFHSTGFNTSKSSRKSIVLGYRSIDELDKTPDTSRQILVSGNHIYRGNDRPCCVCVSTDANPTCRLVTEGTPLRRRSFIVSVGRTYLGTMLSGTVVRVGGSSMDRNDLRDVVLDSLRRLLDRLRSGRDSMERLLPSASLYPPGIVWTRHILQYDLWQRALRANDVGEVTESDVWLWGHYFGVSSGFAWPSTELQRRGNVGRYALYSAVDRVTRAVADTFCRAQDIPVSPKPASTYELEEGVASVLGAAAAACYPHLDEVRRATEILLKEVSQPAIPVGVFRRIAPAVHGKPALKTTRHTAVTRNAVYKSVHEARLRHLSTPAIHRRNALLPLWTPAEPAITEDIQVLLDELRHTHGTNDRQKVWKLLQDGHHLLLRQNVSQDEAIELLMLETAIMRDHFNISGMVVLDVLEHLLPMSDSRRVTIARERSHLLQVHHFHRSSLKWLQIANERMRTSLVRWASPDDRLIEAARNMERMTELAAEINALAPNSSRYDLHRLQMRTQSLLTRVDDADRVLEWRHIAERRVLDSTLWTKIADLQCGFDSRWDDEELVALDRVDQSVKRLGMPLREFAWSARRLVMLLAADRTSEFVSTARRTTQLAIEYGAAWPNQVARVEGALRVARSRRQRSWKQYMSELDELNALLPANTDLALRNPATLPRFVAIGGVPMG